jgi:hypothetical protein
MHRKHKPWVEVVDEEQSHAIREKAASLRTKEEPAMRNEGEGIIKARGT